MHKSIQYVYRLSPRWVSQYPVRVSRSFHFIFLYCTSLYTFTIQWSTWDNTIACDIRPLFFILIICHIRKFLPVGSFKIYQHLLHWKDRHHIIMSYTSLWWKITVSLSHPFVIQASIILEYYWILLNTLCFIDWPLLVQRIVFPVLSINVT